MRAHFLFSILEGYISENSYKFVIAFSYNELYRKRIIQLYIYLIKLNHIKMGGNNMCQIFGYSSSKKIKLNSLLREFYSHSDRHPNGWGLALLDGIHANIERETLQASKSNYLEERFTEDMHIRQQSLLLGIIFPLTVRIITSSFHLQRKKVLRLLRTDLKNT